MEVKSQSTTVFKKKESQNQSEVPVNNIIDTIWSILDMKERKEGSGVCFFSFSTIIQVLVRGKLWAQVLYFSGNECISLAFLKYHTFNFELFIQIFLFPAVFWTFDLCEAMLCLTLLVLKAIKYKMNRWKGIVNPHWEIIWQFLSHGKISTKWNLFNIDEWDSNAPREK